MEGTERTFLLFWTFPRKPLSCFATFSVTDSWSSWTTMIGEQADNTWRLCGDPRKFRFANDSLGEKVKKTSRNCCMWHGSCSTWSMLHHQDTTIPFGNSNLSQVGLFFCPKKKSDSNYQNLCGIQNPGQIFIIGDQPELHEVSVDCVYTFIVSCFATFSVTDCKSLSPN
jgi:hypothetical protein